MDDGLAPLAERLARQVQAAPGVAEAERQEAVDLLFAAMSAQGDPDRLLASLQPGSKGFPGGEPPPEPARLASWKAKALVDLRRPQEAVAAIQEALPSAPPALRTRLVLQLPPVLLAAGDTNAALVAYEALAATDLPAPGRAEAVLGQARLLLQLARPGDAERCLEALVSARPDDRDPWLDAARLQLARLWLARQDDVRAKALLSGMVDDTTASEVRAAVQMGLAEIAERAQDSTGAVAAAELAVGLAQTPAVQFEAQMALARLFLRLGTPDRALDPLRQALRLNLRTPEGIGLQLDIADALLQAGRSAAALQEYQSVIETATETETEARAQRGRAEALALAGRPAEAGVAFLRAVDLSGDPRVREGCLFRAAETLREAALEAQAAETLAKFQALFPESKLASRAALLQGECLSVLAPADAETHFLGVAERFPQTPEAPRSLFLAAQLAVRREATADAVSRYEAVLAHPLADAALRASAHVGLGLIHFNGFSFDLALKDFERAAKSEGLAGEQARYLRAAALYNMGMEQEALRACAQFLGECPDSPWAPDATYWLGRYHFNRQQFLEAEQNFRRFTETWPTRPECDSALLWVARSRFALKQWPEASAAALQLIRDFPGSPLAAEARLVHGESLCERMRFDEAILAFDELLALHPDSPWAVQALGRKGDSLFTLGTDDPARYAEAIAIYKSLLARPGLSFDMQLQAAYKIGRCHEKAGQVEAALETYYRKGVLAYAEARSQGTWPNERAKAWFARAALSAADLYEQREEWGVAVAILQRMAREKVPGSAEALERARKLAEDHPGVRPASVP